MYDEIILDTEPILDVQLFGRHSIDPAAAFLAGHSEKHDLSDATLLIDQSDYLSSLSQLGLSDQVDYTDQNLIEKVSNPQSVS